LEKIKYHELKHTIFLEPDLGNQMTAIAVEPCERTMKLCSNLPLALNELCQEK